MTEEIKQETPKEEVKEAPKSEEAKGLVEKAYDAAAKLKAENDRHETLLKQQQELYSKQLLSGRADAGIPQKSPEEKMKEDAEKVVKGYFG